jgi:hypothetical protein
MCDFKSLSGQCGVPNPPGLKTKIYLAPADDFTAMPLFKDKMTPPNTDPGASVTYGEAFTPVVGGGFRSFDIIPLSGSVVDTAVGETGSKSFESVFNFKIAGTKADQLEFAACILNGCLIGIAPEKSGQKRVLGTNDDYAWVESIELNTGAATSDQRAGTYALKSAQGTPAPVYDAALAIPMAT